MLVMHKLGMENLLRDHFEIGGSVSAAAGPVGRQAAADTSITMRAEILAWSRSHGAFAGVSVNGMAIKKDEDEDVALYGHNETNRVILSGEVKAPAEAAALRSELDRFPKERV